VDNFGCYATQKPVLKQGRKKILTDGTKRFVEKQKRADARF